MKRSTLTIRLLSFIFLVSFLASCNTSNHDSADNAVPDEVEIIEIEEPKEYYSVPPPAADAVVADKNDLKVVLSVDSVMYLGQSGMMQLWLGSQDVQLTFSEGMAQDEKEIPSSVAQYAKITPYAPDFEIKALSTTVCYKIDPSGSEVRYSLTPKDEGHYKVSANIELYETEDCTGVSVPKTARALSVKVGVDMQKEISKGIHQMEKIVWDKFKIFWLALITLIFGAAIFVIRRFVKNKTGYEEGPPTV